MNNDAENTESTHTIRLRGPSRLLWMHNGTQQADVRVQIPCKIEPDIFEMPQDDAENLFLLCRSFGKPTGLAESQCVTLELSKFQGAVGVVLNRNSEVAIESEFADESGSLAIYVAASLLQHNTLEVEFGSLPAVAGEVRLKIQASRHSD